MNAQTLWCRKSWHRSSLTWPVVERLCWTFLQQLPAPWTSWNISRRTNIQTEQGKDYSQLLMVPIKTLAVVNTRRNETQWFLCENTKYPDRFAANLQNGPLVVWDLQTVDPVNQLVLIKLDGLSMMEILAAQHINNTCHLHSLYNLIQRDLSFNGTWWILRVSFSSQRCYKQLITSEWIKHSCVPKLFCRKQGDGRTC